MLFTMVNFEGVVLNHNKIFLNPLSWPQTFAKICNNCFETNLTKHKHSFYISLLTL